MTVLYIVLVLIVTLFTVLFILVYCCNRKSLRQLDDNSDADSIFSQGETCHNVSERGIDFKDNTSWIDTWQNKIHIPSKATMKIVRNVLPLVNNNQPISHPFSPTLSSFNLKNRKLKDIETSTEADNTSSAEVLVLTSPMIKIYRSHDLVDGKFINRTPDSGALSPAKLWLNQKSDLKEDSYSAKSFLSAI